MKPTIKLLIGGVSAALFSLASAAQPATATTATPAPTTAPTPAPDVANICAKARDPQRCEQLQKAKEACKDKPATEKRKCMLEAMPPMDCSKTRSPQRCEATQKAKEACKDKKAGPEHRKCMKDAMPKRDGKGAAPKQ